jgi:hypothetical protein
VTQAFGAPERKTYDYFRVHKNSVRDAIQACRDESFEPSPPPQQQQEEAEAEAEAEMQPHQANAPEAQVEGTVVDAQAQ